MSVSVSTAPEERDDTALLDFGALFAVLLAGWRWIAASSVLFIAIFAVVAFLTTPVYRSSVIMIPASVGRDTEGLGAALGQLGGLASAVGINVGSRGAETEEALAVLRSRAFTERFIADKALMPKIFHRQWDATKQQWRMPPDKQPTPAKAYKYFNLKIRSIVQDKKTGLVTMNIDWVDRNEAAQWANELIQRLNLEMRRRAITRVEGSIGYLEKELQQTSTVATREAIGRLIEGEIKQRMLANVTEEYSMRVVDRAMAPDIDDPVRPKKLKLMAAGAVAGFVIGALFVFALSNWRGRRTRGG